VYVALTGLPWQHEKISKSLAWFRKCSIFLPPIFAMVGGFSRWQLGVKQTARPRKGN